MRNKRIIALIIIFIAAPFIWLLFSGSSLFISLLLMPNTSYNRVLLSETSPNAVFVAETAFVIDREQRRRQFFPDPQLVVRVRRKNRFQRENVIFRGCGCCAFRETKLRWVDDYTLYVYYSRPSVIGGYDTHRYNIERQPFGRLQILRH